MGDPVTHEKPPGVKVPSGRPISSITSSNTIIRKVKRKDNDGLLKSVSRWLLDNQISTSYNLPILVQC